MIRRKNPQTFDDSIISYCDIVDQGENPFLWGFPHRIGGVCFQLIVQKICQKTQKDRSFPVKAGQAGLG